MLHLDTYLFLLKACLEESVVKRVTEVELVLVNLRVENSRVWGFFGGLLCSQNSMPPVLSNFYRQMEIWQREDGHELPAVWICCF